MTIEITLLIAIGSFGIGFLGHWQKSKQSSEKKAEDKAVMSTKLDHIGAGVNTIQVKMEVNDERMTALTEKVIRIDESAKSAHKRIDNIDKGV